MNIYDIRKAGREFCQTEGSEHYKAVDKLEPIDLIIAKGFIEDFCLANIIKYASRFKQTQKLEDLRKISDYANILCGVKLSESYGIAAPEKQRPRCLDGWCTNENVNTPQEVMECQYEIASIKSGEWVKKCPRRSGNDD